MYDITLFLPVPVECNDAFITKMQNTLCYVLPEIVQTKIRIKKKCVMLSSL